ncbi:GtrA family protein [Vibrio genomosp. F10 str. 9ZC157]|uniref:GtrA/DPMS transmembrane domain-containing protein n=1 Tax=Vibrio genomosp. F10 str. ZF-129 TaxID=1187848 RepID=A0A1E5BDD3_9VIBR|nr:GtrA family protein [Vibrio genomosp. F10]OEE33137.1 hypothetical protein A1QO_10675 [Vibrio genomosp. F10 str. ZF-129]OEE95638.1 hypothetical protein A1QM_04675 [Vibrio genomosp. F10 str. 9ZC157]
MNSLKIPEITISGSENQINEITYMMELITKFRNNYKSQVVVITYCLVGIASALVDVGGLKLLSEFYNLTDVYAITIAYIIGMLFNYTSHSILTFQTKMSHNCFVKYLIVVGVNYLLALLIISLLKILGIPLVLSKIMSLPVIFISGFVLSKKWIYA